MSGPRKVIFIRKQKKHQDGAEETFWDYDPAEGQTESAAQSPKGQHQLLARESHANKDLLPQFLDNEQDKMLLPTTFSPGGYFSQAEEQAEMARAMSLSMETYNQQSEKNQIFDKNQTLKDSLSDNKNSLKNTEETNKPGFIASQMDSEVTYQILSQLNQYIYSERLYFPTELKEEMSRQYLIELVRYVQCFSTPKPVPNTQIIEKVFGILQKQTVIDHMSILSQRKQNARQSSEYKMFVQMLALAKKIQTAMLQSSKTKPEQTYEIKINKRKFNRQQRNRYDRYLNLKALGLQTKEQKNMLRKKMIETEMVYMKNIPIESRSDPSMLQHDKNMLKISHIGTSDKDVEQYKKRSEKSIRMRDRLKDKQRYVKPAKSEKIEKNQTDRQECVTLNSRVMCIDFDKCSGINFEPSLNKQPPYFYSPYPKEAYFQDLKKPKHPQYCRELVEETRQAYKYKHRYVEIIPNYVKKMLPKQKKLRQNEVFSDDQEQTSEMSGQSDFYRQQRLDQLENIEKITEKFALEDCEYSDEDDDNDDEGDCVIISDDDKDMSQTFSPEREP